MKVLKLGKVESEAYRVPIEILRKLRSLVHLRRREVKRFHKWAFFDL
jgi:hypothetical protein